jgi:hypothetical protein
MTSISSTTQIYGIFTNYYHNIFLLKNKKGISPKESNENKRNFPQKDGGRFRKRIL